MFTIFMKGDWMKLKHLAAFLMLLIAVGCTQQPSSDATTSNKPETENATVTVETEETGDSTAATVEPETDTKLASATVTFDVTGMK